MADRARLSVKTIGALEQGSRQKPYRHTIAALAAALNLSDDARAELERAALRAHLDDRTAESAQNNLPARLTSFVDRESVVAEIKELLPSHRLITLVGTGGCGKTRCAIEIAAAMLDRFSDGVWLVELAPIFDPSLVWGAIARALGMQEAPNRPILDAVVAYLERKHLLLVLDNCEHVIEEARHVVTAILHGCPDVRIVATSREIFCIAGEQVYRMPSLPEPGSVQLFSDRAFSADNRFLLTVDTAPHVADICRRLDGIPLAIELAAARVKTLSPKQLAQKLNERFRVLTGGDRSALPRHRTMRALIDWSYDLLSDEERALFRKLSIFAGGFTLEAAAAVCSESEMDEIAVFDLLSSLLDKSLVQTEVLGGNTRYRLLESTREYAREKLIDAGEEQRVAHAHARAFLVLAEQLEDTFDTTPERVWQAQAQPELENFRAAISWAFGTHGDVLLGLRLASVHKVWGSVDAVELQRWVPTARQRVTADTPPAVLAALDLAEAYLGTAFSQYKVCFEAATRALARYHELGDVRGIAAARLRIGRAQIFLGEITDGEALLEQVVEEARAMGARRSVLLAMEGLAIARQLAGDVPGARRRFGEALSAARSAGAVRLTASIAVNLAETEFRGGDTRAALRLAEEVLALSPALSEPRNVAVAQYNMAAYLVALGRYDEARIQARKALAAVRDVQYSVGLACTLQHLAAIAALRPDTGAQFIEDRRRAARILGYVDARFTALEALREYTEEQEYDAMIPALRDALSQDELSKLMTEGSTWTEDQAVSEAMLI